MARFSHTSQESKSSNPTTKYLEWKSNDKCFEYYDKEAGQKVKVKLPLKFAFINHYHTVKGWHDSSSSGIWSNEVFYIGKEKMTVRAFKGGEIASGLYKDIKAKVNSAGGRYHRSIYVMLEDGSLANISLKGSAVSEWSDFISVNENAAMNAWVQVDSAKELKKGSVKYTAPDFTLGTTFGAKVLKDVVNATEQIKEYMTGYFDNSPKEERVVVEAEEVDDLGF